MYISGQGGWILTGDEPTFPPKGPDAERLQIEQAWKNVEMALKEAGAEIRDIIKVSIGSRTHRRVRSAGRAHLRRD